MKTIKQFLIVVFVAILGVSGAMADEKAGQTALAGSTVVYQAKYPITVQGAEYELLTTILDFSSGAGLPKHFHGGYTLATVLSGEITLEEKGTETIKKAGESWTEKPGYEHAVVNADTATVRVAVSMLVPKGSEPTTIVK